MATFMAPEVRQIAATAGLMVLVAMGAMGVAATASWWLAGRALSPLAVMGATAHQITESDLQGRIPLRHSQGELPRDELDDLAATSNETLDRLERAVDARRRFVDDTGHELRTPLTIIRGHLELLEADPGDRGETMELVTDELDRMARLVTDLLTLTRADDPAFARMAAVSPGTVVQDVADRAVALGDRDWRMDSLPDPDLRIMADRQRLTQALLSLCDNAVRYTSVGAEIGLGYRIKGGTIDFWVRDTGPGVAPEVADIVFDRFSHDPQSPGTGLGLAIVSAIARAWWRWRPRAPMSIWSSSMSDYPTSMASRCWRACGRPAIGFQ